MALKQQEDHYCRMPLLLTNTFGFKSWQEDLDLENHCFHSPVSHICEVWYGSYELQATAPLAARSGHGLLFLFYPNERTEDTPVLLQLHSLLESPHERQTHGQVAHTHGPCVEDCSVAMRIKNLTTQGPIPDILELPFPGNSCTGH